MAGDFNIGGTHVSKNAVYFSSAAAVGILGYAYWKRRGTATTGSTGTDTGTTATDPSIDPTTGLPYAEEYGYGAPTGGATGYGIYDPATGGTITSYGQTVTTVSTNAQWAQASQLYLTSVGYDGTAVGAALGKALTGQPMTDSELAIYNAAVAFEGYPPNPHTIVHVPPSGQTGGGGTTVTGQGPVTNLKATASATQIHVDWSPVKGANGYHVYRDNHLIISPVYSSATISGSRGHTHIVKVVPIRSDGKPGTSKSITVHMKK